MLILDLWGISFHAVIVFGLGKNLLFKSVLGHCELYVEELIVGNESDKTSKRVFYCNIVPMSKYVGDHSYTM